MQNPCFRITKCGILERENMVIGMRNAAFCNVITIMLFSCHHADAIKIHLYIIYIRTERRFIRKHFSKFAANEGGESYGR